MNIIDSIEHYRIQIKLLIKLNYSYIDLRRSIQYRNALRLNDKMRKWDKKRFGEESKISVQATG